MNADEIKKRLKDMGIPVGEFGQTTARDNLESPVLKRQKEALSKIEVLLDAELRQEQEKMATAHAALQRLKHGGGG